MISIANTRQFGNNAIILPLSIPNDGIFELVLVKPFPLLYYPIFVFRLFTGLLKESKHISFIKVHNHLNIESALKTYHHDGEPKTFTDELYVKILTNKIRVIKTRHCRY
jgi:diacylglycerol kinase (ATP)